MPRDYFKFKQFTIRQDRCAMKVTSLACIQGAWLPKISPTRILDIGAGTGLLSLMAAQKFESEIDAVEIEANAFGQLVGNVEQSPWSGRIQCFHQDIRDFAKESSRTYDFIITNPPFYQNQLRSPNHQVNQARHDAGLRLEDLMTTVQQLLDPDGIISVLLPVDETSKLLGLALTWGIYPFRQLNIADHPAKHPKAVVTLLAKKASENQQGRLNIKNEQNLLSDEYKRLLRPYYLSI